MFGRTETPAKALKKLLEASLGYFRAVLPSVPIEDRQRAAKALAEGGRVMTAISTTGESASVVITVFEAGSSEPHRIHVRLGPTRAA